MFHTQKEDIRFWLRDCWLTLVRGRSTKVDCSPLFANISSKTSCFEIMTLETLQNSCVWLCWDTQHLMILTLFLPRLIHREVTLIYSSNCFSLYPRIYQLPLCHYVILPWSEGIYLFNLNIPLHQMSIRRGSTRLMSFSSFFLESWASFPLFC